MKRLSILVSSLLLAASANAASVSFNYSCPLQTTEISKTGNLGLFDSSLGALTGASIVVNGAAAMSFTGTNTAAQAQNANLTASRVVLVHLTERVELVPGRLDPLGGYLW